MAKFKPTVDISGMDTEELAKLQPGQWVTQGALENPLQRGIFCGVRSSGTAVVLWMGNATGRYGGYRKAMMNYARG